MSWILKSATRASRSDDRSRRRSRESERRLARIIRDPRAQAAAIAAACAGLTIAFVVLRSLEFGYRAPSVHVALETAAALVAFLAAFLVFGRFQRTFRMATLLLACGLGALAVTNFALSALPWIFGGLDHNLILWSGVGGHLGGALLIAASAFAPSLRIRRRLGAFVVCASVLLAVVPSLVVWLLRSHVPSITVGIASGDPRHPDFHVQIAYLIIQAVEALLFVVAAAGFAQLASRTGDGFGRWLSAASIFAAFSQLSYSLYPTIYLGWVYLGDCFRLAFFVLLLVAALREIAGYWRIAALAAVSDERRRLASDLHDGVAQEIAFLRSALPTLGNDDDPTLPTRLAAAAERAELESRRLLSILTTPSDDAFDASLARALADVAIREGVHLDLDASHGMRIGHARAEALSRIAVEAVTNAARHASVNEVHVRLERLGDRVLVCVKDEGIGFDPKLVSRIERGDGRGFGLSSMHARALAIGAELVISSQPGSGTEVSVLA